MGKKKQAEEFLGAFDSQERKNLLRLAASTFQVPIKDLRSNEGLAIVLGLGARVTLVSDYAKAVELLIHKLDTYSDELLREAKHDRDSLAKHRIRAWQIIDQFRLVTRKAYRYVSYWEKLADVANEVKADIEGYLEAELRASLPSPRVSPSDQETYQLAPPDEASGTPVSTNDGPLDKVRDVVNTTQKRLLEHAEQLGVLRSGADSDLREAVSVSKWLVRDFSTLDKN